MNAETLSIAAGALLALGFAYIPGLSNWYESLGEKEKDRGTRKRLVMLASLVIVAGGVFALSCLDNGLRVSIPAAGIETHGLNGKEQSSYLALSIACDNKSAWGLIESLVLAMVANQSTHMIAPRSQAEKAAASRRSVMVRARMK